MITINVKQSVSVRAKGSHHINSKCNSFGAAQINRSSPDSSCQMMAEAVIYHGTPCPRDASHSGRVTSGYTRKQFYTENSELN